MEKFRALIFDVDGTLYRQGPVRRGMLWRLLRARFRQPMEGLLILRVLSAYRRAQEVLRVSSLRWDDLAEMQIGLASQWTGIEVEVVNSYVARWMEREPLDLIAQARHEGVLEFLQVASARGFRLGVFSDYRAEPKLAAMGIADFFDVVVCAQDAAVQKLKPHPRGLQVTLERLGVEKQEALYIGDRPEVDALAACNAGVACVTIGRRSRAKEQFGGVALPGYRELRDAICA